MIRPARILSIIVLLALCYIAITQIQAKYAPSIFSRQKPSASTESDWPNKIWQTWKKPAALLSDEDSGRVKTWHDQNPAYRYELLTDTGAEAFVHQHFDKEPLIRDTFFALTDKILRADFLRYLILLGEGGVYLPSSWDCPKLVHSLQMGPPEADLCTSR